MVLYQYFYLSMILKHSNKISIINFFVVDFIIFCSMNHEQKLNNSSCNKTFSWSMIFSYDGHFSDKKMRFCKLFNFMRSSNFPSSFWAFSHKSSQLLHSSKTFSNLMSKFTCMNDILKCVFETISFMD